MLKCWHRFRAVWSICLTAIVLRHVIQSTLPLYSWVMLCWIYMIYIIQFSSHDVMSFIQFYSSSCVVLSIIHFYSLSDVCWVSFSSIPWKLCVEFYSVLFPSCVLLSFIQFYSLSRVALSIIQFCSLSPAVLSFIRLFSWVHLCWPCCVEFHSVLFLNRFVLSLKFHSLQFLSGVVLSFIQVYFLSRIVLSFIHFYFWVVLCWVSFSSISESSCVDFRVSFTSIPEWSYVEFHSVPFRSIVVLSFIHFSFWVVLCISEYHSLHHWLELG